MQHMFVLFIIGASCTLASMSALLPTNITSQPDPASGNEEADDSALPTPDGIAFIGSGYDLVRGNPDGQEIKNGGVDPGLLPAKRILEISYEKGRKSDNNKYLVPDQIRFVVRNSCASSKTHSIITNSNSYQKELKVSVTAEAEYEGLWSAAFSASASYENMNKKTSESEKVFYEERTVCLKGNAEYFTDAALQGGYSVSEPFASAVCGLPQLYNEKKYTSFLKSWGTNVVTGADLGTKTIDRRTSTKSAFTSYALTNYAGSVSASGGYGGASGSLTVDVSSLSESMESGSKFGSDETTFKVGGENMPEPIAIRLMSIQKMLNVKLYKPFLNKQNPRAPCDFTEVMMKNISLNVQKAIEVYPSSLNVDLPSGDQKLQIDITWPRGTYAIPQVDLYTGSIAAAKKREAEKAPISVLFQVCPYSKDFTWKTGSYYQDLEDDDSSNGQSSGNHLGIITRDGRNARQSFCVKTQSTSSHLAWPKGSYCIAKKGDCPKDFEMGTIRWDDEDDDNQNSYRGVLPDGDGLESGGSKTVIDFCCRKDGFAANPVYLPTDAPFVLYQSKKGVCQQVHGMTANKEWIKYDVEDDDNASKAKDSAPYGKYGRNLQVYYCYYQPNWWDKYP